jgi:transposase
MRDRELYGKILGIEEPWSVVDVELRLEAGEVVVKLARSSAVELECPECGRRCGRYDSRERRWRHLDTCQYRTVLAADVPRVECPEHGVHQVRVPWADPGSRFTALFEALVIDWLQEANITAVARRLRMSWDQVGGVMERAVARGLRRRELKAPTHIGVDETSFRHRHEYVTLVIDQDDPKVLHVADGRGLDSLESFYQQLRPEQLASIESVAMDFWVPYISATRRWLPDAERKIAFDKFHVAMHLSQAVDRVRRQEHGALRRRGDQRLKGTRYLWLENRRTMSSERRQSFEVLRRASLKTARAWMLKDLASKLWTYRRRGWARRAWYRWYASAIRSRLEPVKRVARNVKRYLEGIINAVVLGVTNARIEAVNTHIQWIKFSARGFRNRDRFRAAIYFRLGGLDLYPDCLSLTHTKA